jgi:hypothetical protein
MLEGLTMRRHDHSLLPPSLAIEHIEVGGTDIIAVAISGGAMSGMRSCVEARS